MHCDVVNVQPHFNFSDEIVILNMLIFCEAQDMGWVWGWRGWGGEGCVESAAVAEVDITEILAAGKDSMDFFSAVMYLTQQGISLVQ